MVPGVPSRIEDPSCVGCRNRSRLPFEHSPPSIDTPMKKLIVGACLVTAGCASAGGVGSGTDSSVTIIGSSGGQSVVQDVSLATRPGVSTAGIETSVERVWASLPAVFTELGIPITTVDERQRVLTTTNARISRIGGRRLSSFFECGGTYGNDADSGNALVTIRIQVVPGEGPASVARIEVRTVVASSNAASAGQCSSIGSLEMLLGSTIREKSMVSP